MQVVAIILAAGKSSRMGVNKLLLEIDGESMIRKVICTLLNSDVSDILVVVGYESKLVEREISDLQVRTVMNKDHEKGMLTSFQAGIKNAKSADAALLMLGDQPWVRPETINALLNAHKESRELITIPIYKGKKGHPLIFDRKLFKEILALSPDSELREVVHRHQFEGVEIDDIGVILDVDKNEDLI